MHRKAATIFSCSLALSNPGCYAYWVHGYFDLRVSSGRLLAPAIVSFVLLAGGDTPLTQEKTLPSQVIEEIDVRRIEFPLLARDANGMPVRDLRPDELSVTIRGHRARVAYLEPTQRQLVAGHILPIARLSIEGGEMSQTSPSAKTSPRAVVFFIDGGLMTSFATDQGPKAFQTFIENSIREVDLAAVFSFGAQFRLETAFTSNKLRLKEAVKKAFENRLPRDTSLGTRMRRLVRQLELCIKTDTEDSNQGRPMTGEPSFSNQENLHPRPRCLQFTAGAYVDARQRAGLRLVAALEETLRYARGLDGPVTIYALTHGATLEPEREFWEAARAVFGNSSELDELRDRLAQGRGGHLLGELAEKAEHERVSFAFIDPTMRPAGHLSVAMRGLHQAGTRPVEVAYAQAQQFARDIARETGGVFLEERDIGKALDELAHIDEGRYFVGVAPPEQLKKTARISRVHMSCSRPGVTLSYGRGTSHRSPDSGRLHTRIAIPSKTHSEPGEDGLIAQPFSIGFRAAELSYEIVGKQAVAEMTLHLRVENLDGELLTHVFHDLHHVVPEGSEGASGILTVRGTLEAPPGSYRLVAFLRSLQSDLRATTIRELTIR